MTLFEIFALYVVLNLLLLFWLTMRVGKVRMAAQVSLGDGGNGLLQKRMRAHGNYTEYAPMALLALLALTMMQAHPYALHFFGLVFVIGRVLHAFGMDGKNAMGKGRPIGMMMTGLALLGPAAYLLFLIFTK